MSRPVHPPSPDGGDTDRPDLGGRLGSAGGVDLHSHSTYSDGTLTPAELVREADQRGVRVLGLTDHDTLDGLDEAEVEASRLGLELVPGVELSTGGRDGEGEIHLLGYFVDRDDLDLRAGLAVYAEARLVRLGRVIDRLAAAGLRVDPDHVKRLAGPGTVGRPHIARALVELGHVASIGEAFDRYLAAGRPGFVPRPRVDPEQGIAQIRAAGGVPVLAHPLGTGDVEATVAWLAPVGLAGLEVYYGEYDAATRNDLRAVADRWGLVATGGSDYHGPNFKPGRELGGSAVPFAAVEHLRGAAPFASRPAR